MEREIAHNLATGERRTNDVAPGKVKTFFELNLRREIVLGLQHKNFLTPTMIQAAAIPIALTRKDVLIQSKSGTGKTLIYAIAALQKYDADIKTPQTLVVVPARELAAQVKETFCYLGKFLPNFKVNFVIGGLDVDSDRKRIMDCSIVIGTPGRLLHLHRKNVLCVNNMNLLVLDEADQLYRQPGLHRTVTELIRQLPKKIQRIACSATYERNLDEQLAKSMYKPVLISNSERATVLLGIRQFVYTLPTQINNIEQMNCKVDAVIKIFNVVPYEQVVLFASSKMRADSFRNYLSRRGIECYLISGAMNQKERSEVFDCYRYFKMRTLVATDVFARGVDSPHTNLIINLDPPKDHVDYLHRIGRAGRFGSKGIAITLVFEEAESESFKDILSKAHTGKSVLKFPEEAEKGLDFWNFITYKFPYYMKEEENQQLDEFPKRKWEPKVAKTTKDEAEDAPLKEFALQEEETLTDVCKDVPMEEEAPLKEEALPEAETSADCVSSKKIDVSKEMEASLDDPKNVLIEEEASLKEDAVQEDETSIDGDSLKKIDAPKEMEASPDKDDSKKTSMEEDIPKMLKSDEKIIEEKASIEEDSSASLCVALPNEDKPEISVIACPKLKETIQDALMEDKPESGGEEEHPELPQESFNSDDQKLNSILMEKGEPNNYNVGEDKPDKASFKELIPSVTDSLKEQAPPVIKVTKLEMENDIVENKENLPNNNSTQNPDEYISPELTPSSLTPLDLTHELTLTPPAPPVNSINNKTYCLAAPTATSSLTLQAMVISNTVDDASSISSDGSMGSRSESYSSLYSNTDVKQIWKKYLIIRKRLQRSAKIQTPKLVYNWSIYKCVRKAKIQTHKRLNLSIYKPVIRVKRKSKGKFPNFICSICNQEFCVEHELEVDPKEIEEESEEVCLFPGLKYIRLIEKLENSDAIKKRLLRYGNKRKMSNTDANLFVKLLFDAYNKTYGFKSISEPSKSKENEPLNKLSFIVAHRMDIPPVPAAGEDPATGSEASEASQHSEEFTDDEDDFGEEEEQNSSSGFVESNESASSGIDTSEYDTDSSTEGYQDYQDSDEDDGMSGSLYGSGSDGDFSESEEEGEEESEDETDDEENYTGSNVSLAGTSYQGSVNSEKEDSPAEEPEKMESDDEQREVNQETLAMYQQMFQTQYQFIAAHVASLAEP